MKHPVALRWICLLLLGPGGAFAAGQIEPRLDEQEKERPMTANAETFPNYLRHADSPVLTQPGVEITLKGARFARDTAIPLRGSYLADQPFLHSAGGEPLTRVLLIVVRRDKAGGGMDVLQGSHNLAPASGEAPPAEGSGALTGGYFNIDLRDFGKIITEPGRYWAMVSMGDHVSRRIEFEVMEPVPRETRPGKR